MSRVLVVATSRKTHGGITSVIRAHEIGKQWKKYNCHWVQTHRDGIMIRKIVYLVLGLLDYIVRLPFYDIVHVHVSLPNSVMRKMLYVKIARLFKKRIILHLHCGSQIVEIWSDAYQYLFTRSDVSLLLSESIKQQIENYIGTRFDLRVCYNPCPLVSTNFFCVQKNYILFSGSLYCSKGYQDLIMAFYFISSTYLEWKLVFAGNGEIEKAKRLVRQLGIEDRVEFTGWVSGEDKAKVFQSASIFCLPSYAEGFPMAVLDAWAYGLPVITTPVGGIPDIAKDGDNMLIFTPGDVDALAAKLELLICDASLRAKISDASRELAATTFNIDRINSQLEAIYNSLSDSSVSNDRI
ncbi:MAG: glycosyltransferase family 4 protein [Bacteroidaceae bacterium]|nr:glycosyltransferase family 4 protein [Bacteroidaceae bacterium]